MTIPRDPSLAESDPLLLATDLSARCDRALDRAAQLASEWRCTLLALNVLDPTAALDQVSAWTRGADDAQLLAVARRRLERDLHAMAMPSRARAVRAADTAGAIRQAAEEADARLVVAGMSRSEPLGRWLVGSTVARLARTIVAPFLVVRERVRGPYGRIVVATDFSDASGHALRAAARLFPGRVLVPYHAFEPPGSGRVDPARAQAVARDIEQDDFARFLAAHAPDGMAAVRPVIEQGPIGAALAAHVRSGDVELVVAGSQGRGAIASALLGSTAATLLDWLPCDTLLVRPPAVRA